jgi:hypothetical protein
MKTLNLIALFLSEKRRFKYGTRIMNGSAWAPPGFGGGGSNFQEGAAKNLVTNLHLSNLG